MKIAVIGSRDLANKDWVFNQLDSYIDSLRSNFGEDLPVTILVGGAAGVSILAEEYAKEKGFDVVLFKPWSVVDIKLAHEKRMFFMRNKQIIDNSHRVLVLRNSTEDAEVNGALSYANKRGKTLTVVEFNLDQEAVA